LYCLAFPRCNSFDRAPQTLYSISTASTSCARCPKSQLRAYIRSTRPSSSMHCTLPLHWHSLWPFSYPGIARALPSLMPTPYSFNRVHRRKHSQSMTQIPPPLLQPPHQQLPSLLRPNPAQKPMSPLSHQMTRVVRISRTAADLHATQAGMC
jgi:hypothetical protein